MNKKLAARQLKIIDEHLVALQYPELCRLPKEVALHMALELLSQRTGLFYARELGAVDIPPHTLNGGSDA
jgi:hypothetical protein